MSKYKNTISFDFYTDSDSIAEDITHTLLDVFEDNEFKIKYLKTKVVTNKMSYLDKGDEMLLDLGINVSSVNTNKDIIEADNFSATLPIPNSKLVIK